MSLGSLGMVEGLGTHTGWAEQLTVSAAWGL